jgi:hypothetical protein
MDIVFYSCLGTTTVKPYYEQLNTYEWLGSEFPNTQAQMGVPGVLPPYLLRTVGQRGAVVRRMNTTFSAPNRPFHAVLGAIGRQCEGATKLSFSCRKAAPSTGEVPHPAMSRQLERLGIPLGLGGWKWGPGG